MDNKFISMAEGLKKEIERAYEESITVEEAEKLAGKFLHAQMLAANELQNADLDARMNKTGVKALKAAVYLNEATKGDKKPSDVFIGAVVDSDKMVEKEQKRLDEAEVYRDSIQNYYNIFREAHVFYRQISKGSFSGV